VPDQPKRCGEVFAAIEQRGKTAGGLVERVIGVIFDARANVR
jgi:hypothetical protein